MTTETKHSPVPIPSSYYIHPDYFLNRNYHVPVSGTFGMGLAEPFCPLSLNEVHAPAVPYNFSFQHLNNLSYAKPPQVGLNPTFLTNQVTYNGGLPPTFHPYNTVLSPTSGSSTSLQGAFTPSPASLHKKVQKVNPKSKGKGKSVTRNATQSAKSELLTGKQKQVQRGPIKRPPGASFSELLDGLSHKVRKALEKEYQGCCELISAKNISVKQKHWFTNRHCLNLPNEYQEAIPNFVCPAFLASNSKCRSKAGRYDSTERHCHNCAEFQEINSREKEASPVVITRSKYRAIQKTRMPLAKIKNMLPAINHEGEHVSQPTASAWPPTTSGPVCASESVDFDTLQVASYEDESNGSGLIVDHTAQSAAQPPTTPEPVLELEGLVGWNFDPLQVIHHEGESNGSGPGPMEDHTAQPIAQPPTTSEPVFELGGLVDWNIDPLQVINHEGESNGPGPGLMADHTAQSIAQPPTTSEPGFELEGLVDWNFDPLQVINHEGESNGSGPGPMVDHTAQSITQPPTTSEPVLELGTSDKWDFDMLVAISNSYVSGGMVNHTPPQPTTLEPAFQPENVGWGFDSESLSGLVWPLLQD